MKRIDLPEYLKVRFLELGTKVVREEYFKRILTMVEVRRNLKELPELIELLDFLFPEPPRSFEERLERFANGTKVR